MEQKLYKFSFKELNKLQRIEYFKRRGGKNLAYCSWNVAEQHKLFKLLTMNFSGISFTESVLIQPIKSISGINRVGEKLNITIVNTSFVFRSNVLIKINYQKRFSCNCGTQCYELYCKTYLDKLL